MNYEQIITIEPDKRSGKPCIRGSRITVYDILEHLASGMTEEEILTDFSELTREDIKACRLPGSTDTSSFDDSILTCQPPDFVRRRGPSDCHGIAWCAADSRA